MDNTQVPGVYVWVRKKSAI